MVTDFLRYLEDPDVAVAVAVIKALTGVITRSEASTMMQMEGELQEAAQQLRVFQAADDKASATRFHNSIATTAGCQLFLRYVTRCFLEFDDFDLCRSQLIDRAAKTKNFSVFVTEGRSNASGVSTAEELAKAGIPTTVILDSAVAYYMEQMDIVIVGAEGVVENGGIVNSIGTYSIAVIAQALNKQFYVAAESYKFARLYPLTQRDVPQKQMAAISGDLADLGVLTPSAVSDELIKLYQ
ncbi:Soluble inorganic pyrophosphatase 1 [Phytophthora nicotianae]|uniref:Translation initiation factor eIF2B subunit alpha n=1 Tax=Phytophthora nicotianae TaxID=4792 RepID=A0A0W8CWI1_PHYNI|nr:Soluble inorganic pyrophosphatase 1 [Phytophthora nicotianae]